MAAILYGSYFGSYLEMNTFDEQDYQQMSFKTDGILLRATYNGINSVSIRDQCMISSFCPPLDWYVEQTVAYLHGGSHGDMCCCN